MNINCFNDIYNIQKEAKSFRIVVANHPSHLCTSPTLFSSCFCFQKAFFYAANVSAAYVFICLFINHSTDVCGKDIRAAHTYRAHPHV